MTHCIGIGYRAQSGKDSLANAIVRNLYQSTDDGVYKVYNLSAALKNWCRVAGIMSKKDAPLLQQIGTMYRRANENTWINCVAQTIQEENPTVAIIPDVRYTNEALWIRSLNRGNKLIKLNRVQKNGMPYIDTSRDPTHPSECELDAVDDTFWNQIYTVQSGDMNAIDTYAYAITLDLLARI